MMTVIIAMPWQSELNTLFGRVLRHGYTVAETVSGGRLVFTRAWDCSPGLEAGKHSTSCQFHRLVTTTPIDTYRFWHVYQHAGKGGNGNGPSWDSVLDCSRSWMGRWTQDVVQCDPS